MTGVRVLLAGGTGYVGGHLLAALVGRGHTVTVLSRHADKAVLPAGVSAFPGDLTQPGGYRDELSQGYDAVVCAVGLLRNRRAAGQTFERVVRQGTMALIDAAKTANVRRFVLISANGARADGTAYQRTKWAAEQALAASGLEYATFRPSIVYGADDDFTNQFRRLMRFGLVPYFGKGDYELAPVQADELAAAVCGSLEIEPAPNRTFAVCGPQRVTYRRLLETIKRVSGSQALLVPVPRFLIRLAAFFLGWIPWFPANNDMLTMLFEGNTCTDDSWATEFGITPTAFDEGVAAYLGSQSGR